MSIIDKPNITVSYRGRYGLWRILNLVILGLVALGVFLTYSYIYQNIYNTLYNTNMIINLKKNSPLYELDVKAYDKAREAIEKKKIIVTIPTHLRNVFSYTLTTSSNATSTQQ